MLANQSFCVSYPKENVDRREARGLSAPAPEAEGSTFSVVRRKLSPPTAPAGQASDEGSLRS